MKKRIEEIDWHRAKDDVSRFLVARERESLSLWGTELFLQQLDRLAGYAWPETESQKTR